MFKFIAITALLITAGTAFAQEPAPEEIAEILLTLQTSDQLEGVAEDTVEAFVPTADDLRTGVLMRYRNIAQAGQTAYPVDDRIASLIEELERIKAALPPPVVLVPAPDKEDAADSGPPLVDEANWADQRPPGVLPPDYTTMDSEFYDDNYNTAILADIAARIRALADDVDNVATQSLEIRR